MSGPPSARPPIECGDVYNNADHVFDPELFDNLAHNQDKFGVHRAKTYQGYIYATTENGELVWWEEVWWRRHIQTVFGPDIERIIGYVTDTHGYA